MTTRPVLYLLVLMAAPMWMGTLVAADPGTVPSHLITQTPLAGATLLTFAAALLAWRQFAATAQANSRCELHISSHGIEFRQHSTRKDRLQSALVPWVDIRLISAERTTYTEATGYKRRTRPASRRVLDLYLSGPPGDMPGFVEATHLRRPPLTGLSAPAYRIRLGGPGPHREHTLGDAARVVAAAHPELFYRQAGADQWFTPAPGRASGTTSGQDPVPDESASLPMLTQPVRLPVFRPLWSWVLETLALGGAFALLLTSPALFQEFFDTVSPAVHAVLVVPLLALVVGGVLLAVVVLFWLPISVATLIPRWVELGPAGLTLVRRRLFRWRSPWRIHMPWEVVQAMVAATAEARPSLLMEALLGRSYALTPPAAGKAEDQRTGSSAVVDLYLRAGTTHTDEELTLLGGSLQRMSHPPSPGVADLVVFPARRLRLRYHPGREARGARVWRQLRAGGSAPQKLPVHQLRPALFASAPDLCHGFDDMAALARR